MVNALTVEPPLEQKNGSIEPIGIGLGKMKQKRCLIKLIESAVILPESEVIIMSSVDVCEAKRELYKVIIDTIYAYGLTAKEDAELFRYVIEIGANELMRDWDDE